MDNKGNIMGNETWFEPTINSDGTPSWNVIYSKDKNGNKVVYGYFYCPYIPEWFKENNDE